MLELPLVLLVLLLVPPLLMLLLLLLSTMLLLLLLLLYLLALSLPVLAGLAGGVVSSKRRLLFPLPYGLKASNVSWKAHRSAVVSSAGSWHVRL